MYITTYELGQHLRYLIGFPDEDSQAWEHDMDLLIILLLVKGDVELEIWKGMCQSELADELSKVLTGNLKPLEEFSLSRGLGALHNAHKMGKAPLFIEKQK